MKSKERIPSCYKEGTKDWEFQYNMLLDDGVTCNDCCHLERCCLLFGQRPYINEGRCQFYPNKFINKSETKYSLAADNKLFLRILYYLFDNGLDSVARGLQAHFLEENSGSVKPELLGFIHDESI